MPSAAANVDTKRPSDGCEILAGISRGLSAKRARCVNSKSKNPMSEAMYMMPPGEFHFSVDQENLKGYRHTNNPKPVDPIWKIVNDQRNTSRRHNGRVPSFIQSTLYTSYHNQRKHLRPCHLVLKDIPPPTRALIPRTTVR